MKISSEDREETRVCDMIDSGERAGLPETGTRTPQHRCQGSTDGRQDASLPEVEAQTLTSRTVWYVKGNSKPASPTLLHPPDLTMITSPIQAPVAPGRGIAVIPRTCPSSIIRSQGEFVALALHLGMSRPI